MADVNVGAAANDGTGDPLRSAFMKLNANDQNHDQRLSDLDVRSTPIYATRAAAVAAAGSLPSSLTHIFVREGTALVIRYRTASSDDPLFGTAPHWGVVQRQDAATETAARIAATRDTGVLPLTSYGGTANAITADLTAASGVTSLSSTSTVELIPSATNTSAVTLNVGGAGAWPVLTRTGTALVAGDLKPGASYLLRRRGAAWRVIGFVDSETDSKLAAATAPFIGRLDATELIRELAPAQPRLAGVRRGVVGVDLATLTPAAGNASNSVVIHGEAMRYAGRIDRAAIRATGAGTVKIAVWSLSGSTFTKRAEVSRALASGFNDLPVGLEFQIGDYISHFGATIALTGATGSGDDNLSSYLSVQTAADGDTIPATTVSGPVRHAITLQISRTATIGRAGSARPVLPDDMVLVASMGSRNSVGFGDAGAVTQIEDGLVQPVGNNHSLLPLTAANANGANGDAPFLAFAAAYKARLRARGVRPEDMDHKLVTAQVASASAGATMAAIAGQPAGALQPYAKRLMRAAEERRVGLVALLTDGDRESSGSTVTYSTNLQAYLDNMAATWASVGGVGLPLILSWQFATFRQYRANVSLLQREFARLNPNYVLVTPGYHLGFRNDRDLTQAGLRTLGAYFARAYERIQMGQPVEMLQPVSVEIVGTRIYIAFNRDGLVFDTVTVPAQPAMGFSVKTAANIAVTITAVEIVEGRRVVLTCNAPAGAGAKISYGDLNATGMSSYTGQAGNLRDSAGLRDQFEGVALHNWCALFDWTEPVAVTPTVALTQAAYDALAVKDPGTLYLIAG